MDGISFYSIFFNSYGRSGVPRISARAGCPTTLMPCTPRIIILIWLKKSHGKIIKKNSRNVFKVKATFLNFTWQVNAASCPSKNSFAFAIEVNRITAKVKQTRSKTSKFCLICKQQFLLFQNLLNLSMFIFIIHGWLH